MLSLLRSTIRTNVVFMKLWTKRKLLILLAHQTVRIKAIVYEKGLIKMKAALYVCVCVCVGRNIAQQDSVMSVVSNIHWKSEKKWLLELKGDCLPLFVLLFLVILIPLNFIFWNNYILHEVAKYFRIQGIFPTVCSSHNVICICSKKSENYQWYNIVLYIILLNRLLSLLHACICAC